MDRKIQKIDALVKNYLSKSKFYIRRYWDDPLLHSDDEIWYYRKYRFGIFKDEIAFVFKNNKVSDIIISEYMFGIAVYNIFYQAGQINKYKVVKLF